MREWGVCRVAFGRLGGGAMTLTGKLRRCHVCLGAWHDALEREPGAADGVSVLDALRARERYEGRVGSARRAWRREAWARVRFGVGGGRTVWIRCVSVLDALRAQERYEGRVGGVRRAWRREAWARVRFGMGGGRTVWIPCVSVLDALRAQERYETVWAV